MNIIIEVGCKKSEKNVRNTKGANSKGYGETRKEGARYLKW